MLRFRLCEADTMLIESKPVSEREKNEQTTSEMVLKLK